MVSHCEQTSLHFILFWSTKQLKNVFLMLEVWGYGCNWWRGETSSINNTTLTTTIATRSSHDLPRPPTDLPQVPTEFLHSSLTRLKNTSMFACVLQNHLIGVGARNKVPTHSSLTRLKITSVYAWVVQSHPIGGKLGKEGIDHSNKQQTSSRRPWCLHVVGVDRVMASRWGVGLIVWVDCCLLEWSSATAGDDRRVIGVGVSHSNDQRVPWASTRRRRPQQQSTIIVSASTEWRRVVGVLDE
jgi:hypothetical protein